MTQVSTRSIDTDSPTVPTGGAPPVEERITVALADLARGAEELRRLGLDDAEPSLSFDAAWSSSEAVR